MIVLGVLSVFVCSVEIIIEVLWAELCGVELWGLANFDDMVHWLF